MRSVSSASALMVTLSALALGACTGGKPAENADYKTAAPVPPASITQVSVTPGEVAMTGAVPSIPLSASAGLTTEERLVRLENSLDRLRDDFRRVAPEFAGLNLPETDTNTTTTTIVTTQEASDVVPEMSALPPVVISPVAPATGVLPPPGSVSTPPSDDVLRAMDAAMATPSPVSAEPMVSTPAPDLATASVPVTAEVPAQAAPPSAVATAIGLRVGEHGAKTRLVIDLHSPVKPDLTHDVDNNEKLLLITLPAVTWGGAEHGVPQSSAFVAGWSAQKGLNGGSTIAVQLKKQAKILSAQYLTAEKDAPARLVLDIGPAS